jgi:hypothetical protein
MDGHSIGTCEGIKATVRIFSSRVVAGNTTTTTRICPFALQANGDFLTTSRNTIFLPTVAAAQQTTIRRAGDLSRE